MEKDFLKMNTKEFKSINRLVEAMESVQILSEDIHDEFIDGDSLVIDDAIMHIKNNELYEAIKRYLDGETSVVARDVVSGTGFNLVEILHGFYDCAFGYIERKGYYEYFLCKPHESYNEETGEDETYYKVDENEYVGAHEMTRVGAWI